MLREVPGDIWRGRWQRASSVLLPSPGVLHVKAVALPHMVLNCQEQDTHELANVEG